MAQPFPHSEWYDQSVPSETGPVSAVPKQRQHAGRKAITIAVCVLVILVASVYAFSDGFGLYRDDRSNSRSGFGTVPSVEAPGDYGDFRAFFEEYYGSAGDENETRTGSLVKRAQGDPEITVPLISADGKPEKTMRALYQDNIGSIVGVKARYADRRGYSWGSGVIFNSDGYIVTNQHIVDGASSAYVVLPDGREYEAVLIGEDIQTDLAVLRIEAKGLIPAEFGDSADLSVGDHVAHIGNPLGDELTGTMTDGIISAIDRDMSVHGRQMTLLQTTAAINEGSSGGPLINMYGQVVGIINMKMVNSYSGGVTIEGLGFAIPSATIKSVADQLISGGSVTGRPCMGVTLGSIPADIAERYQLPDGLYVYSVSNGSDALEKGVASGDILTYVNGQAVLTTTEVLAIRDALRVGDPMVLTLWRDGESFDVTIVLVDQNELPS